MGYLIYLMCLTVSEEKSKVLIVTYKYYMVQGKWREKLMTQEERYKITSEDYAGIIIKYNNNPAILEKFKEYSPHLISERFAVIYVPVSQITTKFVAQFGYASIPYYYGLTSTQSLEASGVTKLRAIPAINLRGNGVIVGILDTGIDYTNPVFRKQDGTTKILSLWDQSIPSEDQYPKGEYPAYFGTEYTAEQINQALASKNPLQVVPSMDEIGHGTALAGIAAGSVDPTNDFSGVVPDADLVVVKLKQVKQITRDFFAIPPGVPCYQENDIIWAIRYLIDTTRKLRRPLAIGIGLGTSQGPHNGTGFLDSVVSVIADFPGVAVSVSAGNEGNARRHFYSTINPNIGPVAVELNVGPNETGFTMELWGDPPATYTLDILSPSGEYVERILEGLVQERAISFVFERTVIRVNYFMVEEETGKQVILLRFTNPSPGLWKFQVYGRGDLQGAFHIWLPMGEFISTETYFLNANPYTTVTSPGNSYVPITITAYNSILNTLYPNAGRGYTASNLVVTDLVVPDLAAPGVNISCPALDHSFTTITGTGAAAAHAAGITAMILEWGVVDGNYPGIDTMGIKRFLIRGATRSNLLEYPNRDWGYGIIDIYNSFNILRADILGR